MVARVQVVVDAKDNTSGVLRGIASQFGQLGNVVQELTSKNVAWGNLATQATQLVIDGVKDSIKATQEYAQEIRDLSAISGASAEDTSRFVQVLDDYQLTAQDAEAATRKLTANGFAPNLETIADLSDKYLALNTAQERNKFILDNLGRGGQQWVNLLKQGGAALREQGAAVDQSLIINEQAIQDAEAYRLALDNWNDSVMGVKIAIGTHLLPVLTELMDKEAAAAASEERWNQARIEGGNMSRASAGIEAQHNKVVEEASRQADSATRNYEAMAKAIAQGGQIIQASSIDYKSLISSITNAQSEVERYNQTNDDLRGSQSELRKEQNDLMHQLEELQKRGYRPTSEAVKDVESKISDVNKKLGDNMSKLSENEAAHKKWAAQTIFSFAQTRAAADGAITQGEGEALIKLGEGLDLFDQKTADVMESVNKAFSDLDTEPSQLQIDALLQKLRTLTQNPWDITVNLTGAGAGLGGGACFVADTSIQMADGSFKYIQDVVIGDVVASWDAETNTLTQANVTSVLHHDITDMQDDFYYFINDTIGVTGEHLVYANGDWKAVRELQSGDELQGNDGEPILVTTIQVIQGRVKTYNFHTDHDAHNYFANGILAHNITKQQVGGTSYAGGQYWVGERGPEAFIPSNSGRVLGHDESINALQRGMGGTNVFYGPVTISPDSNGGGDLLSMR